MRVFVIDDENVIAKTISLILLKHGYATMWFTNPLEALDRAFADPPDLVVCDVMMPGVCGIEVAIRIKERNPGCRFLLLSGQAGIADLLHGARERGHHFRLRAKPLHPEDLLREIRDVLAGDHGAD